MKMRTYRTHEPVDFVIVGSGPAGSVLAKELSTAGFDVVVLEQGPSRQPSDFKHDEYGNWVLQDMCGGLKDSPQPLRHDPAETARLSMQPPPVIIVHGVVDWDGIGVERRQRARAVILSANGAETTRLLLLSENSRFPHGLANSSGLVGTHLMPNGNASAYGLFEHPLNEYKSVQVTRIVHDFYAAAARRGFYGGRGYDGRMTFGPMMFAFLAMPSDADVPRWGEGFTRALHEYPTHSMEVECHTTSLPVRSNSISLDPTLKDKWGRPARRTTFRYHPD